MNTLLKNILLSTNYKIKLFIALNISDLLKVIFSRKGSIIEVTIYGIKLKIRNKTPDLSVSISCFSGEFDILKYLYPKDFSGVIVDAGAYIGTAAIALSGLYPKAKIISLEPSHENFQILKNNTDQYKNISIVNKALSHKNSTISLYDRNSDAWGYTIIEKPDDINETKLLNKIDCVKLDELNCNMDDIGIIKMDIEGAEKEILENNKELYNKIPFIFIELHERIVKDCSKTFFNFSKNRVVVKDSNEKFLSILKK
jgi:FkbM family methyltransferase